MIFIEENAFKCCLNLNMIDKPADQVHTAKPPWGQPGACRPRISPTSAHESYHTGID